MERILISMDGRHGAWEALSRSFSLAKRIDARLYALLVLGAEGGGHTDSDMETAVRKRLELSIEAGKADGVKVDYFITEGSYEEEVIRFVEHNKITLLVAENGDGDSRLPERESSLQRIRHRVSCRMEIVSPRKNFDHESKR